MGSTITKTVPDGIRRSYALERLGEARQGLSGLIRDVKSGAVPVKELQARHRELVSQLDAIESVWDHLLPLQPGEGDTHEQPKS